MLAGTAFAKWSILTIRWNCHPNATICVGHRFKKISIHQDRDIGFVAVHINNSTLFFYYLEPLSAISRQHEQFFCSRGRW